MRVQTWQQGKERLTLCLRFGDDASMAAPQARERADESKGTQTASTPQSLPFTPGYSAYALGLLTVVYVLNFVDRQILSILAEPIRLELSFSDTALGLLTGPAFAIFYTFAGIPIARWADVGVRRSIIALALLIWSGMTAVTAAAATFTQLALARIGVGVGEAGCSPPAHSLLSDIFPADKRATALAVYSLGIPIGGALGSFAGGWLGELYGWRMAFLLVGLPGVALALVVRLTLREPPRVAYHGPRETVGRVFGFIMRRPSFVHMSLGAALHAFYGYGATAFVPAFLMRVHAFELSELGTWLFAIGLTTGVLGTFLGGAISDRLARGDVRWYMHLPAYSSLLGIPFTLLFYLWPDPRVALLLSVPASLLGPIYLAPTFAMTQTLVKPHMRAVASSILLFIINLIGLGLGPLFVGFLSDWLKPDFGIDSIRYALLSTVVVGSAWSAFHYMIAARTLREDLLAKDAIQ
jgi:predicted MFS family arabinose efflux permease